MTDSGAAPHADPPPNEPGIGWLSLPAMRYPNAYVWLIFFSSLDIMLTWAILERRGEEVNPVANLVIQHWGLIGAIGFKFSLMLVVITICEVIGRKRDMLARGLSWTSVVISAMPVFYSLTLLVLHTYSGSIGPPADY